MASVQNMVDAAANVALNAVLNVNAAVDGGAQGPYVFTVMRPPPMQLVRVFSYDFRDFDVPGIGGLSFLTAARPFFDALINSHLAFNVAIEVVFNTRNADDVPGLHHIVIPPIACADGYDAAHDWHSFLDRMSTQIQVRIDNASGTASGIVFDSIHTAKLTFVPLRDLAALGPHIVPNQAGGSYVPHPKWIQNKMCMLNIKNKDFQCFRCCMIADELETYGERYGLHSPELWSHYTQSPIPPGPKPRGFKPSYIETDLDFRTVPKDCSMPISLIGDWERVNGNKVGVYVYQVAHVSLMGAEDEWITILRRPPANVKFEKDVKLLLYKGHYSLILDFQKLICRQHMSIHSYQGHTATMACHRCLRYFKEKEKLERHLKARNCVEGNEFKVEKHLAEVDDEGNPPMDVFTKYQQVLFHPNVVYADFETDIHPDDHGTQRGEKTTLLGRNKNVISAAYAAVGGDGFEIPLEHQAWLYRGPNPMTAFLISLMRLHAVYSKAKAKPMKIIMTDTNVRAHAEAQECGYCNSKFEETGELLKCADHNHFTGAYRAAACSSCNSKARLPKDMVILFHNGGGFDFHFIIRGISDLQAGPMGEMTLQEFNFGQASLETKMKIKDLKVNVIARTSERFMEIRFGNLTFRDSINFIKKSLAEMIDSQHNVSKDAAVAFPITATLHPQSAINLDLLLQKIPFPYTSMRDSTCFHLPALLQQSCYDNDLSQEECSNETYAMVKRICETFAFSSFGAYHDCYLYNDILLLADCMEAFRKAFHKKTGIDPAHSVSLPAASKQAMLLAVRETPIELVSEINGGWDFMNDINNNIRGGLSNIFVSYAKANNPKCPGYDPYQDTTWLSYVDVNSLYPTAMCEMMPLDNYKAVILSEDPQEALIVLHHLLDNYEDTSTIGYMMVVTFHIPKEYHDEIDFAPIAKRKVVMEEISERQRQVKEFLGKKPRDQCEKLMPFLGEHEENGYHVAHLKYLRDVLNVKITKVHRIWSWRQSYWLRDYITTMALERQMSSDEVERDVLKLIMNALYGKFLQNKENYTETKTFTDCEKWLRATWKICGDKRHFDIVQGSVNSGESFLGTVTTTPEKGIVLDTPRLQGFAILEITKLIMLKLHRTFKNFYKQRATLCFTDTDSLIYLLKTEDYLNDFEEINKTSPVQVFDLRETGRDEANAGKLGLAKDEAGSKKGLSTLWELAATQPKMYSLKTIDANGVVSCSMKGKGIPTRDLKRLQNHEDYVNTLMHPNIDPLIEFRAMRSSRHQVEHRLIKKRGLTGDNDKVFQLGPNASRPLGHWRNALTENQKKDDQLLYESECASKWPNLENDLKEFRAMKDREAAEKKTRKRRAEDAPSVEEESLMEE